MDDIAHAEGLRVFCVTRMTAHSFCALVLQVFIDAQGGVHGIEIRKEVAGQSGTRDARTKARETEERSIGQEGDESQAGDRHRTLRGATRRRQGAAKEIVIEETLLVEEAIIVEEALVEVVVEEEVSVLLSF